MKKFYAIFAAAVAAMAFATNSQAQITVGAGYGLANQTAKIISDSSKEKFDPTNMSGLHIFGTYEWNFMSKNWGDLSLEPGVSYAFYGQKIKDEKETVGGVEMSSRTSRREHYLDIPVNVKYSYNIMPGTLKLSAFAGPSFSFGLSSAQIGKIKSGDDWMVMRANLYNGNVRSRGENDGKSFKNSEKGEKTGYGIFDLKLQVGIAATVIDKIDVRIGFSAGLVNRMAKTNADSGNKYVSHTNLFQIGVGYRF